MPNYVKNIVTITATKEQLDNLLNELKSEDSCFDFNKIIPMPKSLDIESGSRTQLSYDYHSYKRNKELLPVLESYFKRCASILGLVKSLIATISYPSASNICLNARRPIRPKPLTPNLIAICKAS